MAFFNIDKKVSWKKAILISVGVFVLSIILMLSPSDKTSRLAIFGAFLFILSFFMPFLIRFYPILGKIKEKGYKWKAYSYILLLIFASIILLLGITGPNLETSENKKEEILSQEKRKEPFLEILQPPQDIKEWPEPQIVIKGKTDPDTKIKIQNNEVEVGKDGIFTYTLELLEGKNIIKIIADNGQKQKKITLIIKRLKENASSEKQSEYRSNNLIKSTKWTDNIPQWIKDRLTSDQLKEFVNIINKTSPEFRQTFVSDFAKKLAQDNKLIALGVWARSLGISVNYEMDDAWEIVEIIKRKTNNFAYYRDEIKFLEFVVTVTNKAEGQKEYQRFLESILKNF
jgi:hypothetical protein